MEALEALFTHIGCRIEALHIRSSVSVIDATVFTICSHENALCAYTESEPLFHHVLSKELHNLLWAAQEHRNARPIVL